MKADETTQKGSRDITTMKGDNKMTVEIVKMKARYMVENFLASLRAMGYNETIFCDAGFILYTEYTKIICYCKEGR